MTRGLPPWLLAVLFVLAACAPLILALASGEPPEAVQVELGIGLGLASLALMLLQFAHSGRLETIAGRIGIDRTMRVHRSAGIALAVMVLLHPLAFVLPPLLTHPELALRGLMGMLRAERMQSGVIALVLLLVVVAASLARSRIGLAYDRWRALHAALGLAAATFAVHHALRVGLYSEAAPLRWFWLGGLALAAVALVWTWGIKPIRDGRAGWRVAAVAPLGPDYWEVALERPSRAPLPFAAGQFAWLAFGRRAPWDDNPFSIASAPGDPRLAFVIREAGDLTRTIGSLPIGSDVRVDAPHGAFVLDPRERRAVLLIAGGAGIAPILSLWRDLASRPDAGAVRLVYGAWTAERLLYREQLTRTAAEKGFGLFLRVDEGPLCAGATRGILDEAILRAAMDGLDPHRTVAMVCGPTPMMLAVAASLERLGLPPAAIRYERFDYD
ncbi:ferredoxin reductase family protein [Elioraea tepidiphila]|jgi:predicted ferric reductase|uniref:ferredoxin reductase family protein n=1 Tax=Elioraea tepidiphila TaxID=457934 RepID=UPI002FDAF486